MSAVAARSTLFFNQPPKSIGLVGQLQDVTYTTEQLDEAVRGAYEHGLAEARNASQAEIERLRKEVASVIDGSFRSIVARHEAALSEMRNLLPRLVVDATSRVVAGVPVDESLVRAVVVDLLADVAPGAETVEVQLCAADLAKVTGFDQELRHKFPSVHLQENKELAPGDCIVKTRFGVLDGRRASKLKAVEALLS